MKKSFRTIYQMGILACSLTMLSLTSCIKQDFDTPPDNSSYDPNLTVTHTIREIIDLPSSKQITEDWIVSGIVNIDDKEGNYYKKITIQDATGGLEILLDQNNLYNDYPVGRKIYVKLKGLYKGDYNGIPQIGYTPDGTGSLVNIPYTMISNYLVKANYPNTLTPDTVSLATIASPSAAAQYINKLIVVKDVEFVSEVLGLPIANQANISSATNRNIQECSSPTKVAVRTSGYAKFQPQTIPGGNGTITAVYTVYGTTPQLVIRSMNDLNLSGVRCDGSSPTAKVLLNESFTNLDNWTAFSVTGDQVWNIATYGNPKPCAYISGFSGSAFENEDWLISKEIDLNGLTKAELNFESAGNYSGDPLTCYISTDYVAGSAPSTATWTLLPATYDTESGFVFTPSGAVDLSAYLGQKIRIAFKYTSNTSEASAWELDNVKVTGE